MALEAEYAIVVAEEDAIGPRDVRVRGKDMRVRAVPWYVIYSESMKASAVWALYEDESAVLLLPYSCTYRESE